MRSLYRLSVVVGLLAAGVESGYAQNAYPEKPVHIVVGYPAGGTTDIVARLIGRWLTERLGQPFIVENKPGAGSNLAAESVINSPPDGYRLMLTSASNAVNQTLYKIALFLPVIRSRLQASSACRMSWWLYQRYRRKLSPNSLRTQKPTPTK